MQSCSRHIFYLPVSIQRIFIPSSFYVPLPLLMKWQKEWLTAEIRLLPRTAPPLHWHTHALMHNKTQIHHSCFMWVGPLGRKSPISMTRGLRIRVKNCHSRAIVGAPWFRRALKSGGKERSAGLERRNLGQLEGSREKWRNGLMIQLKTYPYLL